MASSYHSAFLGRILTPPIRKQAFYPKGASADVVEELFSRALMHGRSKTRRVHLTAGSSARY